MGRDCGVVDVTDAIVPMEGLRHRIWADFEDRRVVQLGFTGAMLFFITDLLMVSEVSLLIPSSFEHGS